MREQREKTEAQLQDRLQRKYSKGTKEKEEEVVNVMPLKRKKKTFRKIPFNNSLYLTPPGSSNTSSQRKTNSEIINLNTVVCDCRKMEGSRD